MIKRAGLETGAIRAMHVFDVEIGVALDELVDLVAADITGFVGGIVKHLDLEAVARVADRGHGIEQTLGHIHLVNSGSCTVTAGSSANFPGSTGCLSRWR